MASSSKWRKLYDELYQLYGDCTCQLKHESPFQLLVAVMLSAQCRDDRVNVVTKELFALAPDPVSMAKLPFSEIARIIRPCGLGNSKGKNLVECTKKLIADFDGKVPHTMEELTALPGIGRKSANVILGDAFKIPGFPVDTHVKRLLNRIGLVNSDDPVKIESEQNAKMPPELWTNFSHILILHGRLVCHAQKPSCQECAVQSICRAARTQTCAK